ncbi:MAG: ATP-binding cassette domain-containing protein [Puniceicoccales bacterium]|jgi:putative ABC transport system ATP-binding protein|nr:ATP-binding cassette domain-containing protein [Puniceicoccales bacterium]
MLILRNIGVKLNHGTALGTTILKNLTLHVKPGEFVVIIGGNGAGKSTLFNVIAGLLQPTSGKIILDGKDVTKISQHRRSRDIARVVQNTAAGTMANLTIFENLALAFLRGKWRKLLPYSTTSRAKFFSQKLGTLGIGLEKRIHTVVANLSGGQRQAISLLMSILAPSKILLLDEITAALDPLVSNNIMALADEIIGTEGRTTLMITHNMAHAIKYGDKMLLLANHTFLREFSSEEKKSLTPSGLAEIFSEI